MSRIHPLSVLALCLLLVPPTLANTLVEDFSTTALRNSVRTTADWNTAAGELGLFPYSPTAVGAFNTPRTAREVAVDGTPAYVADQTSGLQVIDNTDRSNPVLLGFLDTPAAHAGQRHPQSLQPHYANRLRAALGR